MPNQIYTRKFEGLNGQTYIIREDMLYKGLVHADGGQVKKFTTDSSSKALPLFYILLRVNIDVKI